jgi:ribulose-phosphate 3-epimerase
VALFFIFTEKNMKHLIAPSLLSANFLQLEHAVEMINQSQADWFHLDVMDGVFVPNISFGMPVIQAIKKRASKPLDVHLMIVDPDRYIGRFKEVGADILSVHYEACTHLHRCLQSIRSHSMKAGVVLNPHTPVHLLDSILEQADLVLLMSVNPGFGGQHFITETLRKISKLKEMIIRKNLPTLIEVDGGVTLENKNQLLDAGADVLVAGNSIFNTKDPQETILKFKE